MRKEHAEAIYNDIKKYKHIAARKPFNEAKHCIMMLEVKGRLSAFCVEALVSNHLVYEWLKKSPTFQECYAIARMFDKEEWVKEGLEIRNEILIEGERSNKMEYWKMIGWERFGIGKTSRVRLDLNPEDSPDKHYSQLIAQAKTGEFTAGEIKQLMEAINAGLNAHQVIKLQKEIEQLQKDLAIMDRNTHGNNTSAVTRVTQTD